VKIEEAIKYERFKMATYVAEFVNLNEIVDFRDICEGSTDGTFVILCVVASLMYVSPQEIIWTGNVKK
jgi:hypothetical protein